MCGRYASSRSATDLALLYGAEDGTGGALEPAYNIAPTDPVPAVLLTAPTAARRLVVLRWGLVPSWAADTRIASRLINARLETVADKPVFRAALARRRCLLPVDGYYEWQARPDGRQPFFLSPPDGRPRAFAGLYEVRRRPGDGPPLCTATIVTTAAPPGIAWLHDRAPVLLGPREQSAWLDPGLTDPRAMLLTLGGRHHRELQVWPVGRAVNSVLSEGPSLVTPVG